jgi:hypothetical protein
MTQFFRAIVVLRYLPDTGITPSDYNETKTIVSSSFVNETFILIPSESLILSEGSLTSVIVHRTELTPSNQSEATAIVLSFSAVRIVTFISSKSLNSSV